MLCVMGQILVKTWLKTNFNSSVTDCRCPCTQEKVFYWLQFTVHQQERRVKRGRGLGCGVVDHALTTPIAAQL